jgi:hypothetical protein
MGESSRGNSSSFSGTLESGFLVSMEELGLDGSSDVKEKGDIEESDEEVEEKLEVESVEESTEAPVEVDGEGGGLIGVKRLDWS